MKLIFQFFILNLFFIQFINAQNCNSDSIVVRKYYKNQDLPGNLVIQKITETSVFVVDSGIVHIHSQVSSMGNSYTPLSNIDTFWVKTDTSKNGNGNIIQVFSKIGTITGWQNYRTINYQYNNSNSLISKTQLSWNGSAWDSVYYSTWDYDIQNNLIQSADYDFTSGVRNNLELHEIVYQNNQPYSKTISKGILTNQWEYTLRLIFTYTGNLRTSILWDYYDAVSSSWITYGIFNYGFNFGEYSFILPEYNPVVVSGMSTSDTVLTGYDTLEEKTYSRNVHFTAIDTTNIYFGVQGAVNYTINKHFNNQLLTSYVYGSSWATLDLTDSIWYSVDRPYTAQYFYDSLNRCDTILITNPCTNPCDDEKYFTFDNLGRPLYNIDYSYGTTWEYYQSNTYYYSDTSSLSILMDPIDTIVYGCPGGVIQPNISVIGGCQPYTCQWQPPLGLSSDTVLQPDILIDSIINYQVIVHDNLGHSDTANITIGPGYDEHLIIDSIYCNGNTVLHLPYASGTFNWFLDSMNIPLAVSNYYTATLLGLYHASCTINIGDYYTHAFTCSIQSDTIIVNSATSAVLSLSYDTLFVNLSGSQYDWYHDSTLISSGTDSFFIANQPGLYYVIVIQPSSCSIASNVISIINTGLDNLDNIITIYPNPVQDKLLIKGFTGKNVIITDLTGKIVLQKSMNDYYLDVSFLNIGCYFLFINNGFVCHQLMFIKT